MIGRVFDRLAVLLPGFGYTLDMPLFYYAENLLLDRGWDVLRIEYAYNQRPEFQTMPKTERERWLLAEERLRQQIRQYGGPSLFVIGTADPHYDPAIMRAMQDATNGESVVVEGADHGMDIPGDPVASVRAVERVVAALSRFL